MYFAVDGYSSGDEVDERNIGVNFSRQLTRACFVDCQSEMML